MINPHVRAQKIRNGVKHSENSGIGGLADWLRLVGGYSAIQVINYFTPSGEE